MFSKEIRGTTSGNSSTVLSDRSEGRLSGPSLFIPKSSCSASTSVAVRGVWPPVAALSSILDVFRVPMVDVPDDLRWLRMAGRRERDRWPSWAAELLRDCGGNALGSEIDAVVVSSSDESVVAVVSRRLSLDCSSKRGAREEERRARVMVQPFLLLTLISSSSPGDIDKTDVGGGADGLMRNANARLLLRTGAHLSPASW